MMNLMGYLELSFFTFFFHSFLSSPNNEMERSNCEENQQPLT